MQPSIAYHAGSHNYMLNNITDNNNNNNNNNEKHEGIIKKSYNWY